MKTRRSFLLPLANTAVEDAPLLGVANAFTLGDDGWALIPYGDSLHNGANAERANGLAEAAQSPGVIQRFTRERAVAMAEAFHSLRGKIKRAIIGYNLYKGHPDCAAFANFFRDKSPRGTIADIEARDTGLALKIVLNEQGAADVEAGYREFSPFWLGTPTGQDEQGRKIYEPTLLKSVGLVTKGNIPGLSLVNADPATLTPMKNALIQLLALLGITVPPETADDAFAPFLDQAQQAVAAMKPKVEMETELAAANTRVATAESALATAQTALANAQTDHTTALANVRTAAATAVVSAAIATGKIPAAERETQLAALANAADFAAAASALSAKQPTLPTGSRLGDLGAQGKGQQSRQQQLLALVNAHMETAKVSYDAAFAHVTASPAGKALVDAMQKPATK